MAEQLKDYYKDQEEIGKSFDQEWSNFNKTSRARRTVKYRDGKLAKRTDLWTRFEANQTKISALATKIDPKYTEFREQVKVTFKNWGDELAKIVAPVPLDPKDDDEPELANLLRKQMVRFATVKKMLIDVTEKIEEGEELTMAYCKTKLDTISTLMNRITEGNENFMAEVGMPPDGYTDQLEQIEELAEVVMVSLQGCLTNPGRNNISPRTEGLKLQRTTIPKFNGDYAKWISFRDLFVSMVITNETLSNAQRMQLLKTNISGEAEGLIGDLSISDANFTAAWEKLLERYDKSRIMVYQYMNKLLTQQVIKGDAKSLKKLLDTTDQIILALGNLGRPTKHWDDWIVVLLSQKLSDESRRDWERKIADSKELPTWLQLKNFLHEEFRMLEGVENNNKKPGQQSSCSGKNQVRTYQVYVEKGCPVCTQDHGLFTCEEFRSMTTAERWELAKKETLCFGCLRRNHDKTTCKVKKPCKNCNRQHSTWLHEERSRKPKEVRGNAAAKKKISEIKREEPKTTVVAVGRMSKPQVLLATAIVITKDVNGQKHKLRALIDQGSQGSLMTKRAAELLQFTPDKCQDQLIPLGEGSHELSKTLTLKLWPHFESTFEIEAECYIMKKLTTMLPNEELYTHEWKHLKGLQLADPTFNKVGPIDLLF